MRIRLFLAVTSIGLFGAGFAIQACGSTTNDAVATADSGPEAAVEASIKDTSVPDAKDAAPPCDPNKDILVGIMDASIADGASSVGLCLGCAKTKCAMQIAACTMDCDCQGIAGGALECFAKSQSFACAAPFSSAPKATQQIGIALAGCLQQDCPDECQTKQFMDGGADADAEAGM
jgi:hypothetical protein